MTDHDYQAIFDEVYKELVTPTMRAKLAKLVEHAGDPIAAERDQLRRELDALPHVIAAFVQQLAEDVRPGDDPKAALLEAAADIDANKWKDEPIS